MHRACKLFICFVLTLPIFSCNQIDFSQLKENPLASFKLRMSSPTANFKSSEGENRRELSSIITATEPDIVLDGGFSNSLKLAVESDPRVVAARQAYKAQLASVEVASGDKDFQVSGSVYGGVEDVSDETVGMAVVLNARRVIYDGGLLVELELLSSPERKSNPESISASLLEL